VNQTTDNRLHSIAYALIRAGLIDDLHFLPVSECHQLPAFEQGTETGKEKSRGKTRGAAAFCMESVPDTSARAFRDTGPLSEKSTGGAKEKLMAGGRW
jgi:hypothetical protein